MNCVRSCVTFLTAVLSTFSVLAQEQALGKFGFQDVFLNMEFSKIPGRYTIDCASASNPKFLLCTFQADVGTVPMTVDLSLDDQRVVEIHAYFPLAHYDTVWLALRQKYGSELRGDPEKAVWIAHPLRSDISDSDDPDRLELRRKPLQSPRPDGHYYMTNVEYSVIHYESFAPLREGLRKRLEEHERKVKGVAEKL